MKLTVWVNYFDKEGHIQGSPFVKTFYGTVSEAIDFGEHMANEFAPEDAVATMGIQTECQLPINLVRTDGDWIIVETDGFAKTKKMLKKETIH